ncbi:hypothetical protein F5888DRAFT_1694903, partial [Russula emetica]
LISRLAPRTLARPVPGCKTRIHLYLFPIFVLAHVPLQTFLDFNATYILTEVAKFPNPDSPRPEFPALVVTGSWAPLHTLRVGFSGYSASFLSMRSSTFIKLFVYCLPHTALNE